MKEILKELKSRLSVIPKTGLFYKKSYYSQEGEDIIINKLLHDKDNGFYIDIGAHHPFRYSNTYLLYKRGFRGINIDADKKLIELFKKARPDDINIACAVSDISSQKKLYIFKNSALNTISKKRADIVINNKQTNLLKTKKIKTQNINKLLSKNIKKGNRIDLLNLDIEGNEYEVLKALDFNKFTPQVICVEVLGGTYERIHKLLTKKGYEEAARTVSSTIFKRS